jgi:hypothetical protein
MFTSTAISIYASFNEIYCFIHRPDEISATKISLGRQSRKVRREYLFKLREVEQRTAESPFD